MRNQQKASNNLKLNNITLKSPLNIIKQIKILSFTNNFGAKYALYRELVE